MHILIAEDDLTPANSLEIALELGGAGVGAVRPVADAMSCAVGAIRSVVLDLLVIGWATVSLSKLLRMPDTPILSITGFSIFAKGDHNEGMTADYLIRKPVLPSKVTDTAFYLICRGKLPKAWPSI